MTGLRNVSQLGASKLFDLSLVDDILEIDFRLKCVRARWNLCRSEGLLAGPQFGPDSGRRTRDRAA